MYCNDNPLKHEHHKSKKTHRNLPSFSSTLLDEICRSIDVNGGTPDSYGKRKPTSVFRSRSSSVRDEEIDRWIENDRLAGKKSENDLVFFSSNSSSSDSSGALSSSDSVFFALSTVKIKRPKPVRTTASPRINDCFSFDENKSDEDVIESKSRALKFYSNLKKLKQPISPGAKLTNLINSFFTNRKKSDRKKVLQELKPAAPLPCCSSAAPAATTSCLSKSDKMSNGIQRSVRFDPVGLIVNTDSKPCGKRNTTYDDRIYGRPPLPPNAFKVRDQRKYNVSVSVFSKHGNENEDEEEEEDALSESSSDLFELDHLSLYGKNDHRYCEELPVYKTTYFDKNRV